MLKKSIFASALCFICLCVPFRGGAEADLVFSVSTQAAIIQTDEAENELTESGEATEIIQVDTQIGENGKILVAIETCGDKPAEAKLIYSNAQTGDTIEIVCAGSEEINRLTGEFTPSATQQGEYTLDRIDFLSDGEGLVYTENPVEAFERGWPAGHYLSFYLEDKVTEGLPILENIWFEAGTENKGMIFAQAAAESEAIETVTVTISLKGSVDTQQLELSHQSFVKDGNKIMPSATLFVSSFEVEQGYTIEDYSVNSAFVEVNGQENYALSGELLQTWLAKASKIQQEKQSGIQPEISGDTSEFFWTKIENTLQQAEEGQIFLFNAQAQGAVPASILRLVQEKNITLQLIYDVNTYTFTKETVGELSASEMYLFSDLQSFITYQGVEGLDNPDTGVAYRKAKR